MTTLLRNVLVLLVAAWLAAPTVCDEGGENNGGTGVWILPCCANVPAVQLDFSQPAVAEIERPDTSADVKLKVASQVGAATATLIDDVAGVPIALPVVGRIVTLPKGLLQAMAQSYKSGTIIISDANQRGYVLRVNIANCGKVRISLY